jgi:hypothetical protein
MDAGCAVSLVDVGIELTGMPAMTPKERGQAGGNRKKFRPDCGPD